ncbi:MAG TPA: amidohydrolase family protein, partial [Caulobacteraceae bacterium]|nr:amidohydrolase family protein [Caulobacteraceae bacterium]
LIRGLVDHHIHLLATAAQAQSLDVTEAAGPDDFARRLRERAASLAPGRWLRVTGYHERSCGPLSRLALDAIAQDRPVRVQHQTGAAWVLNSAGFAALGEGDWPDAVERGPDGGPTGWIFRGDAWLQARIGREAPALGPLGATLAAFGITSLTDASASTDAAAAAELARAHRAGELPQRLMLMSAGPLAAPDDGAFAVGPVKVLLDDRDLPPLEDFAARIAFARREGRPVAVHCVTAAELAVTLAAFQDAGARAGDRIEHGGVIAPEAIAELKALGLVVVTQPGFVLERGDRYLAEVEAADVGDLYRCGSLLAAGVPVAFSSDAPYGPADPWTAMRAAVRRTTRTGRPIGAAERVDPALALSLFQAPATGPGTIPGPLSVGEPADLCLLASPLAPALAAADAPMVAATLVGGRIIHRSP